MRNSIALVDCDGVLADFVGGALRALHKPGDPVRTAAECTSRDLVESYGIDRGEYTRAVEQEGFCAGLDVLPGARDAIDRLRKTHEVFVVTKPFTGRHWMAERTWWLREHFDFDAEHVIHAAAKKFIEGDMLIEDDADALFSWCLRRLGSGVGFLWSAPYNAEKCCGLPNMIRVGTWIEVLALTSLLHDGKLKVC